MPPEPKSRVLHSRDLFLDYVFFIFFFQLFFLFKKTLFFLVLLGGLFVNYYALMCKFLIYTYFTHKYVYICVYFYC